MGLVVLCLVSGGMDSITACVKVYRETGVEPVMLSVSYGQKHEKKIQSARKLADFYGWHLIEYSMPKIEEAEREWHNLDWRPPEDKTSPQKNLMLLSIALRYLEILMKNEDGFLQGLLVTGFHRTDWHPGEPVHPDTRPEFVKAVELAANLGSGLVYDGRGSIQIRAPFVYTDKAGVAKTAFELGVPLFFTWTCYRDGEHPCGRCPACKTRLNAFMRAGIPDPLTEEYEELPGEYSEWYRQWRKMTGVGALVYWIKEAGKKTLDRGEWL